MPLQNTRRQFGALTKFCHWALFFLIMAQYLLIMNREYFAQNDAEKMNNILLHKSFGVTILILGIIMVLWRHVGQRPPTLPGTKPWEKKLAIAVHSLLYITVLIMPISGILMSQFHGYSVKFFAYALPTIVNADENRSEIFSQVHEITAWVLLGLVVMHITAAIFHHIVRKDIVLKRMLPFGKLPNRLND